MCTVRLEVYIQPRASKSEVAGMRDGVIKIRVAAPAVENAANLALMEFPGCIHQLRRQKHRQRESL
jgi:uncharacterized protein YggU (UPF0235/DUF167 family)